MVDDLENKFKKIENSLWDVFNHNMDLSSAVAESLTIARDCMNANNILVYHQSDHQKEIFSIEAISPEEKEEIVQAIGGMKKDARYVQIQTKKSSRGKVKYAGCSLKIGSLDQGWVLFESVPFESLEDNEFIRMLSVFIERVIRIRNISSGSVQQNYLSSILDDVFSESRFRVGIEDIQLRLVSQVRNAFSSEAVTIAFIDYTSGGLILKKSLLESLVERPEWVCSISAEPGEGLLGKCIDQNTAILENDICINKVFKEEVDGIPGFKTYSIVYVPISIGDIVIGAIGLHNKKNIPFYTKDIDLLLNISKTIAIYLFYLQIIQQLQVQNADLEANNWELVNSRNTLRTLFDNIPDSVYIIDRKYRLNAVNMARSQRAGKEPRHIVGKLCYEALYDRDSVCPGCMVEKMFFRKEITHRLHSEWEESSEATEWTIDAYPIFNDENDVVKAILIERDVTEKNRLETIIAQSEKLAAVGQLAAGIAHEINNPLTVILANAQLLQRDIPGDNEEWVESVNLIYKAGSRASYVVRNLLDFARKEKYDFVPTNINDTIARAVEMVKHELIQRSVQLEFDAEEKIPNVLASADHLHGLWLNIIINAIDACDSELLKNRTGLIQIKTSHDNKYVRVKISDNGMGMTPDKLKRIFEPFFTTKEPNRGTGLGLSVSHRVIRQHGGHVKVESEIDDGTTFLVLLPIYH